MRVIPIEKQSKKNQREFYKKNRTHVPFNTGERDMGKEKNKKFAEILDKEIKEYYN